MSKNLQPSQQFLKDLDALRDKQGDDISLEDICSLLENNAGNDVQHILLKGMQELSEQMNTIRIAVGSEHPDHIADKSLPDAHLELDAVVKHTEEAANAIMDAAEAIMAIAGELDEKTSQALNEQTTRIFEASNFQDITGQRISNVLSSLVKVDKIVTSLLSAMDGKVTIQATGEEEEDPDKALMNGPQLNTPSQDDIDQLFAES